MAVDYPGKNIIQSLLSSEFNVYHDCIFVVFENEPIKWRIFIRCHFKNADASNPGLTLGLSFELNESEVRDLLELLLHPNGDYYLLEKIGDLIFRLVRGIELRSDLLSGYQFDRDKNKNFSLQYGNH